MKQFPKGTTLIKIFTFILALVIVITISVRVVYETENKQLITLKKSNFESYFDVDISYSLTNKTAKIKYSIEEPRYCSYDSRSSDTINVIISVSFYKKASTSGIPIKTEEIDIELHKSNDFKKTGSVTVNIPQNAKGCRVYISNVDGKIYAYKN